MTRNIPRLATAALIGCLSLGLAAPAMAQDEPPPEEAGTEEAVHREPRARCLEAIDRRLDSLARAQARIDEVQAITPLHEAAVDDIIDSTQSGLTRLSNQVEAADDPATLVRLCATVAPDYRVYLVVLPQAHLTVGADRAQVVNDALGALRVRLGQDLGIVEEGWRPLWVVDFPMFEWDEKSKRWMALHHPFTAPSVDDPAALEQNPHGCLSRAYDMVLNGTELGGGSIRIHRPEMQQAVFRLLGIGDEEARQKFGFLLDALDYGCPPHGGIAFGLDRLVMLMSGANSIREVMAFPKTQTAACLLTEAPTHVGDSQLRELNIRLRKQETT